MVKCRCRGFLDSFMATLVITVFLFLPTIWKKLLDSVDCLEIGGEYRLRDNVEIVCYQERHLGYMVGLACLGMLFWGLGVFGLTAWLFRRYQSLFINVVIFYN